MNLIGKYKWLVMILWLASAISVKAAELTDFSWHSSSNYVGDKGVTYTFEYTLKTDEPAFIFYGLAYNRDYFDSTAVGNPLDLNKVSVLINGTPAAINASGSYNYGSGMYIRLVDSSVAKANDQIKVTIEDIEHGSNPGTSSWRWLRTASGGGQAIDEVSSPTPITLQNDTSVPAEFANFSWQASSNIQSDSGVTYTFEYDLVTAEPYSIFHAQAYEAVNTSALNNPIDINNAIVTINGQPAAIDTDISASYNLGTGVTLRLQNPALATAGANIKVVLNNVKNGDSLGSFDWQFINTAKRSGHPIDEVSAPDPITLVADSSRPSIELAHSQFNSPAYVIPDSQYMGSWSVAPIDLTNDQEKDLLVSHYSNGSQGIASVLNNTDGTFSLHQFQTGDGMDGAYGLTYGDVNADGLIDAISAGPNGDNYTFINEGTPSAPNFSYGHKVYDTNNTYFYGQRVGHSDLDQDGHLDIIWAGSGNTIIGYGPWVNNQYSSMTKQTSTSSVNGDVRGFVIGDIDSDGDDDIIKARGGNASDWNGGIQILLNDGARSYTEINFDASNSGPIFAQTDVSVNPNWVGMGDFDGNGTQDIVFFNQSDTQDKLFIGLNTAPAGQTPQFNFHSIDLAIYTPHTQSDYFYGFVKDVNGDGYEDIITAGWYTKTIILLGRGDGSFEVDQTLTQGRIKAVDDIDQNGAMDLVLDTNSGLEIIYQDQVTTITSEWEKSGGQDSNHIGNDYYTFELTEEQHVTIELASSIDSHMYLIDQNGTYLENIDNSGNHATFSGILPPGVYEIVSGTFEAGESGEYKIFINSINEPTVNKVHLIKSQWRYTNGNDLSHFSNKVYDFSISTDSSVSLRLDSSISAYIYLLDSSGEIIANAESNVSSNEVVLSQYLAAGSYRAIALTKDPIEKASFKLKLIGEVENINEVKYSKEFVFNLDGYLETAKWSAVRSGYYHIVDSEEHEENSLLLSEKVVELDYILNSLDENIAFEKSHCNESEYEVYIENESDIVVGASTNKAGSARLRLIPSLTQFDAEISENFTELASPISSTNPSFTFTEVSNKRNDLIWITFKGVKEGVYKISDSSNNSTADITLNNSTVELVSVLYPSGDYCREEKALINHEHLLVNANKDMEYLTFGFRAKTPGVLSLDFTLMEEIEPTLKRMLTSLDIYPETDVSTHWEGEAFGLAYCNADHDSCRFNDGTGLNAAFAEFDEKTCVIGKRAVCFDAPPPSYTDIKWINGGGSILFCGAQAMDCHESGGDVLAYRPHPNPFCNGFSLLCGYRYKSYQYWKTLPKNYTPGINCDYGKEIDIEKNSFFTRDRVLCRYDLLTPWSLSDFNENKTYTYTDGYLNSDWLKATPSNTFGALFQDIPQAIPCEPGTVGCFSPFYMQCNVDSDCTSTRPGFTYGICREVKASVLSPGMSAKKMCVTPSFQLVDDMYMAIRDAEKFVDLSTLDSLADRIGRWKLGVINALVYLSNKPGNIKVRLTNGWTEIGGNLFSSPKDVNCNIDITDNLNTLKTWINNLGGKSDKLDIAMIQIMPKSSITGGWNHSKILAVDGHTVFTGGQNLWDSQLEIKGRVLDLGIKAHGDITVGAHNFLNTTLEDQYAYNNSTNCGGNAAPKLIARSKMGTPSQDLLKFDESTDVVPGSISGSKVSMLAVGRVGQNEEKKSIDKVILESIKQSKHTIYMSLQDIGPISHTTGFWPSEVINAIADAINRGVNIHIFLSGYGVYKAQLNGSYDPRKSYGGYQHGYELNQNLYHIGSKALSARHKENPNELLNNICSKLHLYEVKFNADLSGVPGADQYGNVIANHSKAMLFDNKRILIGSHNIYPHDLTEFGIMVEDQSKGTEFLNDYWMKLKNESADTCISGVDCGASIVDACKSDLGLRMRGASIIPVP
jgi:hypothetical protein